MAAAELVWTYYVEHTLLYCFHDCSVKLSKITHFNSEVATKMPHG